MHLGFGPDEGLGVFIVGLDEMVDVLAQLGDGGERGAAQGLTFQDGEPDLDLIEPGRPGRGEVEMYVLVSREPAVVLGLVGVEVVKHDVDLLARIGDDDGVHEGGELDAPPALFVRHADLAAGHLEGSEQGQGAVALVVVAAPGQGLAVGQLEIALRPLQRLDRGLLVDADHHRILRRRQGEGDHIGGLGGERRVLTLAPELAPGQVDLVCPQEAPDLLFVHIAERPGDQWPRPAPIAGRPAADPTAPEYADRSLRCTCASARCAGAL